MVFTGFFDTLMVGKVGTEELAAAGISNSIFFFVAIFPMGVTMAFATIVGRLQGKNKTKSYHLLARDAFIITLALAAFAMVSLWLFTDTFALFKQTDEVAALAIPYLRLLMWSIAPMLIFFFAKNICDGFSYTISGMVITITALALNILLNWVFIFGHWGSEAYGLNGAGYATIISRMYLALGMLFFMFKSSKVDIHISDFIRSFIRMKRIYFYNKIFTIGFPTGLQYFFEIAAFAAAAVMAGWWGAKELAAHNLAITLASLTYMFASGIAAGSSICVAKAYGNKNAENVRLYGINGHKIGITIMLLFAIIFWLFDVELASMFSKDKDVIKMGAHLLFLAAIFQLGDGIQAVSVGLLRGVTDVNIPSFIVFVCYWVVAMPAGYFLSKYTAEGHSMHGVNGIWIGLSIGLTLSAIALSLRFYALLRKS